jgi:hypothetical protein
VDNSKRGSKARFGSLIGIPARITLGSVGFGEFFDALLCLGEDVPAAFDESYAAFVLGDGLLQPGLAGFDALDDGLELFEGLFESQVFGRGFRHVCNVATGRGAVQR